MNISNQGLRDYLELGNVHKGDAIKKKTDLIEMIIYGCITNKLNKEKIEDISTTKHTNQLLKRNGIILKSLPGYGNAGLKKKDMKPVEYDSGGNNKKPSIKVYDWWIWSEY